MGIILWLEEHRRLSGFLAVIHMCAIFFFSSISHLPQPETGYDLSTLAHLLEYAILGFLLSAAVGIEKKKVFAAILIAGLYGVTDEVHQFFVPGRVASIYDAASDFLGAVVGSFSAIILKDKI
jgi:VanZ family protein